MGRQTNSLIFCLTKAKAYGGEKGEEERKKRKKSKEKKEKNKGMFLFCMESSVFWMSRVIGVIARVFLWRMVCPKPKVLVERSHKPLIC